MNKHTQAMERQAAEHERKAAEYSRAICYVGDAAIQSRTRSYIMFHRVEAERIRAALARDRTVSP